MKDILNLERYPIHYPESPRTQELVEYCRSELAKKGMCVLEEFIHPDKLSLLISESQQLESAGFHKVVEGNAYLTDDTHEYPEGHARRRTDTTALAAVAYDQFPKESVLRRAYEWDVLKDFIGAVINKGPMFRYDCPLGALNLAVMREGDHLRWHFDQSDFVVSIPVQEAEAGGKFECVRKIRTHDDEQYARVRKLLEGDREGVETLETPPGSLVLFEGRYTIHRVTPIEGKRSRLVALLSYDLKPGTKSSPYLSEMRYGRANV